MLILKILLASCIESIFPLVAAFALYYKKWRKTSYLLFVFAVLTMVRPMLHEPSTSLLFTAVYSKLVNYNDLVGKWHLEKPFKSLNKIQIYDFSINEDGTCILDYISRDLTMNEDSRHKYKMICQYESGILYQMLDGPVTDENAFMNSGLKVVKVIEGELTLLSEDGTWYKYQKGS